MCELSGDVCPQCAAADTNLGRVTNCDECTNYHTHGYVGPPRTVNLNGNVRCYQAAMNEDSKIDETKNEDEGDVFVSTTSDTSGSGVALRGTTDGASGSMCFKSYTRTSHSTDVCGNGSKCMDPGFWSVYGLPESLSQEDCANFYGSSGQYCVEDRGNDKNDRCCLQM
eukprot:UN24240